MSNYNFISYSSVDALEFAFELYDSLLAGPPSIPVWLDKRELHAGQDWDEQIIEAIRTCDSLIFVMTHDSVEDESVCKLEWTRALKYNKAIVPILLQPEVEMPFRLGSRQWIDFTGDFDTGLAQLRLHLRWLASPEGMLQSLKDRLEDARRDHRRAEDQDQQIRIEKEMNLLKKQIEDQQRIIDDPERAAKWVEESITRGIERERRSEKPISGVTRTKIINPPPAIAPTYFQDRHVETNLIGDFLKNDDQCLMTIVGRGGIGKTAMVCRLLKSLEGGRLPDNGEEMSIDGIIYLSEIGTRKVTVPNLYTDLSSLLPDDVTRRLDEIYRNPKTSIGSKIQALLEAFPSGRVILLLDYFDPLIDYATRSITSGEIDEALTALLNLPPHAVKVILTTKIAPQDIALIHPERQFRLDLRGLESPYAENILREMDADGTVGLRDAPDELLNEARERTLGNPRALEALFAIPSADRDTELQEILSDRELLPENVVEVLVGEAFSRLDPTARKVMEALAIYGRPVSPSAVDYLLQLHVPGVDSAPVLNRLVNMQFVSKEEGRYYMHPVDRQYALSRVPKGDESDRDEPVFTQFALLHRGANFFKQVRTPKEKWKIIDDISAQLTEFDLRCEGQEYDTAADVLLEIDEYLYSWTHYQLLANLHERLQGNLSNPVHRHKSLISLNRAYRMMGVNGWTLIHTLRGHDNCITQISWMPNGKLVSASLDGNIRIWNIENGTELCVLSGHTDSVFTVSSTPDGKRLISGSADKTIKVWDLKTKSNILTLKGHTDIVTALTVTSDGRRVISASFDGTLIMWDLETGKDLQTFIGHTDRVNDVAVTMDGKWIVSGSSDKTVKVWDLETGEVRSTFIHPSGVNSIEIMLQDNLFVTASEDNTIRIWDLSTRQLTNILEGHTAYITSISLSCDGHFMASKSADSSIRLWDFDKMETITILDESSPKNSVFAGLAFSPQASILATLGEEDMVIRIWDLDFNVLLSTGSFEENIRYTTMKIALVGDNGVGKTGLGWCLKHGMFKEHDSTHGQQFWVIDALRTSCPDGTECEVVLWDFAGQPDYRLIHALFLDDVDLALVLFDPTERQQPLKGVEYWLKQLGHHNGLYCRTILVAARVDRGTSILTRDEIEKFCLLNNISGGYIETSAKSGVGISELMDHIREQLATGNKPPTVTPKIFSTIKTFVLKNREDVGILDKTFPKKQPQIFISPEQLNWRIFMANHKQTLKYTYNDIITAVGHLAKHGYVTLLGTSSGEQIILLAPDILNNLAASFVLEARRNNLGCLDEARVLQASYNFPELAHFDKDLFCWDDIPGKDNSKILSFIENNFEIDNIENAEIFKNDNENIHIFTEKKSVMMSLDQKLERAMLKGDGKDYPLQVKKENGKKFLYNTQEKEILLDSVVVLFLKHNICLRKTVGKETLLVFPSLINEKPPFRDDIEIVYDISYGVSGAIENIYPSLVVQLGYTNIFTSADLWQNQAQYKTNSGEVCGFRQVEEYEGEIELELYYGSDTSENTLIIFRTLFERYLNENNNITINRYPSIICSKCGYHPERIEVKKKIQAEKTFFFCSDCGEKISLPRAIKEFIPNLHDKEIVYHEIKWTRLRTGFETALISLKRIVSSRSKVSQKPSCFISYAWGQPEYNNWVRNLALDFQKASIEVFLDQFDSQTGSSVARFISSSIEKADFIVVIGTQNYRNKYENKDEERGRVLAFEFDLIANRLMGTEKKKHTILPLLLEGEPETSLPPQLHGRVFKDFRQEEFYFVCLFDLILTLYDISSCKDAISLRDSLKRM